MGSFVFHLLLKKQAISRSLSSRGVLCLLMNIEVISPLESLSCMWILKIDGSETGMNGGTQRNVRYHEDPPY